MLVNEGHLNASHNMHEEARARTEAHTRKIESTRCTHTFSSERERVNVNKIYD